MKTLWGGRWGRKATQQSVSVADRTVPSCSDGVDASFEAFRKAYPAYDTTRKLDELRATDYARLDQQGQVYLDYTGGGLYAQSQVRGHMALLSDGVFGNPHSKNLTSMAMTHLVEHAREYVLTETSPPQAVGSSLAVRRGFALA